MRIDVGAVTRLHFADGSPVRAASGVAPYGDGYVVVQDDAVHAAWVRDTAATALRLLPAVEGLEVFEEASGTKHLKPDLEAACALSDGSVLFMGSGSSPRRMRWALLDPDRAASHADLTPLYVRVATALDVPLDVLNLEGACVVGDRLRWFHRGMPSAGFPSASVDLALGDAVALSADAPLDNMCFYDLGAVEGVGLAVTDAVTLPDGSILLSAAAEDSPNPRDDGPVVGSALVRVLDCEVADAAPLPLVDGRVAKVEGLMLADDGSLRAVVDVDDPGTPSLVLTLRVS